MDPLRLAIVGCGFWARFQIAAWRELAGVEIVALYNRTRSKAEALAEEFGIAAVYDDAETLIRERSGATRPHDTRPRADGQRGHGGGGVSSYTPTGFGCAPEPRLQRFSATPQPAASRDSSSLRLVARNGSASSTRPPGARFASKIVRSGGWSDSP